MSKDVLYLGSKSRSRRELLQIAEIDHKILEHKSDECGIDIKHGFTNYVLSIAQEKMEHLDLPSSQEINSDYIFVLTADTMAKSTKSNQILGKPKDKDDAIKMLKILCDETVDVVTGCCLEKKVWKNGKWELQAKEHWTTNAIVEFCVEPESLEKYFEKMPNALNACTGGIIEGFGSCFLKSVNGSYTTVLGLPLYEVRQKLKKMGFKI